MEKIRINKEDTYKIEVNDAGEYIEFDLLDIELPMKCLKASNELKRQTNLYNKKVLANAKQYKDNRELLFINKNRIDLEFCKKMREVFDGFLGKDACQKIFGDTNRIGMFADLFDQLMPHFEKMKINTEKIKKRLLQKYSTEEKSVI